MTEGAARSAIVDVCRRLWERGLIAGQDGNVSVRLGPDRVLVTPAGLSKVDVGPDELVVIDLDGRHVHGDLTASSEVRVHLAAYRRRPDVGAVVHAHPPTATAFAVAGEDLSEPVLPEVVFGIGPVPLVPYGMPGTDALAERCGMAFAAHDAILMANHGATTVGSTLTVAHQRMESLEHAARILLRARLLGRVTRLTEPEWRALADARAKTRPRGAASDAAPAARHTEE